MSKYYKKNNKKSFMAYSRTVSYPNNPLLYTYHKKERLRKKFVKYEWWNEELSDYLYSSIDDIKLKNRKLRWRQIAQYQYPSYWK